MRLVRYILLVAVMGSITAAPALSCLLSFSQMTKEEMVCCKHMAGDCGAMNNSSHSCCKRVAQAGDVLAFNSNSAQLINPQLQTLPVVLDAIVATFEPQHESLDFFSLAHSPPLPNGSSLVLRI